MVNKCKILLNFRFFLNTFIIHIMFIKFNTLRKLLIQFVTIVFYAFPKYYIFEIKTNI